jgi:hypothetical protein
MKKVVLLLSVCMLFALKGYSQFSFGVAPGLSANTAYFGFKAGKVVPYVGFQFANVKVNTVETGAAWDDIEYDIVSYSNEMKISGNLYVPNVGIKFFAIEKNKLKAYFNLSVAKPMIRANVEIDGEEMTEISDLVKDIKLFGGEFGFGVEYFVDDNFSVGGEFGLRYIGGKYTDSYTDEIWNYDTDEYEEVTFETTYKASFSPTYTKISLSFYFGSGGGE